MHSQSDLLISCAIAVTFAVALPADAQEVASARGRDRQTHRVSGVVRDASREPIAQVEIAMVDSAGAPQRSTTTDGRGRFDFGQFESGKFSLRARRLGYQQHTMQVQVSANEPASLEIVLVGIPEELERIRVTAPLPPTKLHGFYERSRQNRSFGRFFDAARITRMNPRSASELFRSVPGVTLSSNQSGGNLVRIRGCQPMVWIDDQRVPGAEVDDLIVPSEIAAIEFYPSSAGIPAQYLDRGNRLCGVILVWTKTG